MAFFEIGHIAKHIMCWEIHPGVSDELDEVQAGRVGSVHFQQRLRRLCVEKAVRNNTYLPVTTKAAHGQRRNLNQTRNISHVIHCKDCASVMV